MTNKLKCKSCSRKISGKINIKTYSKKIGRKFIEQVDYYCNKCFKVVNIERSWDVYRKEKRANKKKNNR